MLPLLVGADFFVSHEDAVTVQIHLPMPPSTNRLWVRARKGMRKSDAYSAWLDEAGRHAKAQRPGRIDGPLQISIHAARPDKRKRDVDNVIKPVLDLLQAIGVIRDDSDCEMVSARWVTVGEGVTVLVDRAVTEQWP